jgi:hypothetical protein
LSRGFSTAAFLLVQRRFLLAAAGTVLTEHTAVRLLPWLCDTRSCQRSRCGGRSFCRLLLPRSMCRSRLRLLLLKSLLARQELLPHPILLLPQLSDAGISCLAHGSAERNAGKKQGHAWGKHLSLS